MTQRFLTPRLVAAAALALAAGGAVIVACGSDSSPSADGDGTSPTPSDPNSGAPTGAGGASSVNEPGNGSPQAIAGASAVSAGGTEGVPNNVGVDPGNPPASGGAGSTATPPGDTPAVTGHAPNCDPPEGDVPNLTLELVAGGLTSPIYFTGTPGDDSRLFVLERAGRIRVLVDGVLQEQPFLDIEGQIQTDGERGLLNLAFHPRYAENGLFYVHYSSSEAGTQADGVIVEYAVDPNNRSLANPASRRLVLNVDDTESNHNGGTIAFGRDGQLYIGFGDGGGGNDQHGPVGNGQSLDTLLGKILRINVDARDVNDAYGVPEGNLAAQMGVQARPEIWAYGLRNPWRFSFDACTADLYIGDVGQTTLEEIDFLPANTPAGANFGWRIMEGPNCRPTDTVCPQRGQAGLTLPVDSYARGVGTSVTGGYVYRGSNVPGLRGTYIYADYNSARFFSFRMDGGQLANRQEITAQMRPAGGGNIDNIASFGQDNAGEVYVVAFTPGAVYRVAAAP